VVGGTLIAAFDGGLLRRGGRFEVVVRDGEIELVRVELVFARMR
jgi:hypothetical protein